MPIPTRCPACGNTSMVYEQFVGQTIPCQACGRPMLVTAGPPMPPPPSGGSALPIFMIVGVVILVLVLAFGGIAVALFLPAVQSARSAARRMQSHNNLKQIGLAVHMYMSTYRALPPAVVRDPNGRPLYSGFVLLLPFMERADLYDRFQKDQAWDSPANLPLSSQSLPVLLDPGAPVTMPNRTDYQFVTGQGTMFEDGRTNGLDDVRDGTSNTVMIVAIPGSSQSWAAPGGWDVTRATQLPLGNDGQGASVALADGSVKTLPPSMSLQDWQSLASRAGGEVLFVP